MTNRLSILHMMGWTTATAVYLGIKQPWQREPPTDAADKAIDLVVWLTAAPINGVYLTALVVYVTRYLRRLCSATHPGEWLLVVSGAGASFSLAVDLVWPLVGGIVLNHFSLVTMTLVFQTVLFTLQAVLYAWAVTRLAAWRAWQGLFCGLVGYECLTLGLLHLAPAEWCLSVWYQMPGLMYAVALCLVVAIDLFHHARLPWTHWLGVALGLSTGAYYVFQLVVFLCR